MIFISYSSLDLVYAQKLAARLTAAGFDCWWDTRLKPGDRFASVIHLQLERATSILVLWSRNSVASDWVIDEATEGKRRQILVPATIDGSMPPLGFRQLQTADLTTFFESNDEISNRGILAILQQLKYLEELNKQSVGSIQPGPTDSKPNLSGSREGAGASSQVNESSSPTNTRAKSIAWLVTLAACFLALAYSVASHRSSTLSGSTDNPSTEVPQSSAPSASGGARQVAAAAPLTPSSAASAAPDSESDARSGSETQQLSAQTAARTVKSIIGEISSSDSKAKKEALKIEARSLVAPSLNFGTVRLVDDNPNNSLLYKTDLSFISYDPTTNLLLIREVSSGCRKDGSDCQTSRGTLRINLSRINQIDSSPDDFTLRGGASFVDGTGGCDGKRCVAFNDGYYTVLRGQGLDRLRNFRRGVIDIVYNIDGRPAK